MKFTIKKQNNGHTFKFLVLLCQLFIYLFFFLYSQLLNSCVCFNFWFWLLYLICDCVDFSIRLSLGKKNQY